MKRILLICAAALLVLAAAALIVLDLPSFPPLELDRITSAAASTVLYDARGEELNGLYSGRERVWAPLSALPEHLPQAFIAAEDARFYSHPGVDVRRIFGLRSHNYTISCENGTFIFDVIGYGHGVGMSQWGAKFYADQGKNYRDILRIYYKGISFSTLEI